MYQRILINVKLGCALLFLITLANAENPSPYITLDHFEKCGFISRFSPNKIDPECFQQINNAYLDQDYSILRRNGYAPYNSTPCTGSQPIRGMWSFFGTDGSQYLIMQSSQSMFSSKGDGLCTPITGLNNLSPTAQMSCVQTLGYLWCTDGIDTPFRTNVTSTDTVSQAPLGKYIGAFRNRVLMGSVSGTLTNVYLSGELNGLDWTLPTVSYSTSPAILRINGINDGLSISCMMGEFQNNYYIGRNYDLYALAGYDLRDFAIRKVSEQIGCMDNNSVQEVNNSLNWLSHRGVESLSGTQITWMSYPIDPTIKTIITAAGNSQSQLFTTQADWQNGNLTASGAGAPMSATISPGDVVPSSWSVIENSGAQWSLGTLTNVSTSATSISLSIATNNVSGGTFPPGNSDWICNNNAPTLNACSTGINAPLSGFSSGGYLCAENSDTGVLTILGVDSGNNTLFTTNVEPLSVTTVTINIVNLSTPTVYLKFFISDGANTVSLKQSAPTTNGFNYSVIVSSTWSKSCNGCAAIGSGPASCSVWEFTNALISSYSATGVFTSTSYTTSLSTPTWGDFLVSQTTSSSLAATFTTQVSSDGITFDSALVPAIGQKITSAQKKFIKYTASLSTTISTRTPTITSVGLAAETTGYYITPCVTATGNTAWGVLAVNGVTNGGSFTFSMSTSAISCAQVIDPKNANWTTVAANSIPSITDSSYTAVRVLFGIDVATQVPTLNDITVQWNAGASRPPVASANYQNRYYMFYTTSTAAGAANDHAVVLDQNQKWVLFDDQRAASADLYLNSLYIGDSQATGTAYLFDSGSSDNNGSYNFSFTTPDLDGGDPVSPKQFSSVYMFIGAPSVTTQGSTLSCNYTINGSTVSYSLGSVSLNEAPEQSGYFVAELPFPVNQPVTANWINLSCSNNGNVGPIRIYGIRMTYRPNVWPE
jgi:hypothetical protein